MRRHNHLTLLSLGMLRGGVLIACFTNFIMLLSPVTCQPKKNYDCQSYPSSCGNIHNISYPFRLKGDPQKCGRLINELSCENNRTILQIESTRYYVEEINYTDSSMRVVDTGLQKDNCSSLPLYSWTPYIVIGGHYFLDSSENAAITFISCETPVNSSSYIDTSVCNSEKSSLNSSSSLLLERHSYVVNGSSMDLSDLVDSCSIDLKAWASKDVLKNFNVSFHNIHDALVYGFHLRWGYYYPVDDIWFDYYPQCYKGFFRRPFHVKDPLLCFWNLLLELAYAIRRLGSILFRNSEPTSYSYPIARSIFIIIFAVLVAARILWSPCVLAILVYKWRRRHLSMYDSIEEFIQRHNKLMPVRYSYSDIRKMTKGFKDKLGEGGFGSVFKGKLRSGHLVAVKILDNSKANGQDFINEVATIGRIHHVNVACLIGFCADRSKRALVYDFMPNGSLEKYIFPREGIIFLSFEKLYAISLGIARGIEYLHGGCDMQILHFDIKPHNILLDEKFTPKVSDFGLAKLYPTDDSIVNLTAARGTMGYMAPELFYKNIGGVSYKADVYSFGMLLMEMSSKRKNLNPFVEHLSQIYFPSWVYDQFSDGKDIEMGDITEEERKIAKKMIIVAFWCIQLKPTDRPSMSKVVEMLEGNVELQMPPKPFLSPQEIPVEDHGININSTELTISSGDSTDSISLSANEIEMIQIQKSYD